LLRNGFETVASGQRLSYHQLARYLDAADLALAEAFDPVLQESFLQETRAYFAELLDEDEGIDRLVDSDFVFLNGRLARHYDPDVPIDPGEGVQKVALPAEGRRVRGGLVTRGAVLKVTADGTHTSPMIRGVFINERILGIHIPPPPPGIPAIEPDVRGAVSIREPLVKHRESETCVSCHLTIDPPGFALENFDPIGGWRTKYGSGDKGAKVDPSGLVPDGDAFDDIVAWKEIYRERDVDLARGFVRHFLTPHLRDRCSAAFQRRSLPRRHRRGGCRRISTSAHCNVSVLRRSASPRAPGRWMASGRESIQPHLVG